MFTGLIETMGSVVERVDVAPGARLTIEAGIVASDAELGDSIAVNGCCLTVVHRAESRLTFEAGEETLSRTNLGRLQTGSPVNLERSLRAGDRLGGHYVTGHVDASGQLLRRIDDPPWARLWFTVPAALTGQLASKGSVTVDGVSLTLVDVTDNSFSVALIPHTLSVTTLGQLREGDPVNIETDVLAKYVERQLQAQLAWKTDKPSATSPTV
ncbi:riboflavin synthase [Candidatus Laterigemmans baculatus]|uniref:riboflavin synthase n=1 Tax=Candidatus Laterigemmans baculatus TaxID=2770505 RepID=UPI0013DB4759|nr:riboflavin synthase [Candidatus Laterigemmans baculatus]